MAGRRKNRDYYTTGEAAEFLDLPRRTVTLYCAKGRIKAEQHPVTMQWKIQYQDLVDFMKSIGLPEIPTMPTRRVLVVDDDPQILRLVSMILDQSKLNIIVDIAEDGYKALLRIGQSVPDLVILDIQMPNMDGKTLLRTLKQDDRTKNIKILVATGFPDDAEEMMQLGANQIILKPFRKGQLINEVIAMLGLKASPKNKNMVGLPRALQDPLRNDQE